MILKDVGCLLIDNARSRAYLQKMAAADLIPAQVIFVKLTKSAKPEKQVDPPANTGELIEWSFANRRYLFYDTKLKDQSLIKASNRAPAKYSSFDPKKPTVATAQQLGVDLVELEVDSINHPDCLGAVEQSPVKFFVFGGGGLLGGPMLSSGKKFIHVHPGWLPLFRGSFCVEWSVLIKGKCAATAFFMAKGIDSGSVIARREFAPPELEAGNMPPLYSSHIRSELLVEVLNDYARHGTFNEESQTEQLPPAYYKMHPSLNLIALESLSRTSV